MNLPTKLDYVNDTRPAGKRQCNVIRRKNTKYQIKIQTENVPYYHIYSQSAIRHADRKSDVHTRIEHWITGNPFCCQLLMHFSKIARDSQSTKYRVLYLNVTYKLNQFRATKPCRFMKNV